MSALRAYSTDELLALARTVPGGMGYRWQVAHHGQALMLMGHPVGQ